jgi:transposase
MGCRRRARRRSRSRCAGMDDLEAELVPVRAQIAAFAHRQVGCKTLTAQLYGVGPLVAAIVWAFLGDARRFSSPAQAVRYADLDVTVHARRP